DRLFPAAVLPTNPDHAADELRRAAGLGFKVGMIRPFDAQGRYPNQPMFEPLWRAFEDTGLVVAMHNLVSIGAPDGYRGPQWSPGQYIDRFEDSSVNRLTSQTLSFVHEAQTWLPSVLLTDFFERHPGITRMAVMEGNAAWAPSLLEELDRGV